MRKLLLILAVFLSAVGFTTHAQADLTPLLSESPFDNPKQCLLINQRYNKFACVNDAGAPAQTTDYDQNTFWVLQKATAPEGVTLVEGVTPVYLYNVATEKYMLHGEDSQSTPVMSEAEADPSEEGLWYIFYDSNTWRISAKSPGYESNAWTFPDNKSLLDEHAGTGLTKWNLTTGDEGNSWKIIEIEPSIDDLLTRVTSEKPLDVVFHFARSSWGNFYLGAKFVDNTPKLFATKSFDSNTTWSIEKGTEEGSYYIKNKSMSTDTKAYYLARCADWTENLNDWKGKEILIQEFELENGSFKDGEAPIPYTLAPFEGNADYGMVKTPLTCTLTAADGKGFSFLNPDGGVNGVNEKKIAGWSASDGGSAWHIEYDIDAANLEDFQDLCTRYNSLIDYLDDIPGLLQSGAADVAKNAISSAKSNAEDNFTTARTAVNAAMTELYKNINSINVLLESKNGKHLANHMIDVSGENEPANPQAQPHAHSRIGFASVWQLSYSDGSDGSTAAQQHKREGLHIQSFYRGENEGVGSLGQTLANHGFYLDYAAIQDEDGNEYEGVVFVNNDDHYLGDHADDENDPQTTIEDYLSPSTLWDIIPVALPKTIEANPNEINMIVTDAPKTIEVFEDKKDEESNDEANGVEVNSDENTAEDLVFTFTSDTDGEEVMNQFKGVVWTIEDSDIAELVLTDADAIEGYKGIVDEDGNDATGYNGYRSVTIKPKKAGTTTITATSIMSESLVKATDGVQKVPSCEITLVVKKAPLSSIEASHDAATIARKAKGDDRNVEVTIKTNPEDYDLTAGSLTAALTKEGADDIAIEEFALKTASAPEVQLMSEDGEEEAPAETPAAAPAVYVAKIPANVAPGTYNLKVNYNEGEGDDAIEPKSHTAEATITIANLESLTASIPADTKIAASATERTVELTVVPNPATYVVEADQLTVTIGEGDDNKCSVAAAPAPDADSEAPANKFIVTIPTAAAAGEHTLTVSFKETTETTDDIEATVAENGTLNFEITALPVYAVTLTEGDNPVEETIEMTAGDSKTISVGFTEDGKAVETAPTGWTATLKPADGEAEPLTITDNTSFVLSDLTEGTYTLTIAAPTEDADYTFTTKTVTITVNPATVEPTVGEITAVASIEDANVAITEGETVGTAEINGKLTISPENAKAPTDAELTFEASTDAEGVESVTISDIEISEDGTFTATATVNLTTGTEITEDTEVEVTVTPSVGTSLTLKLTLTPKTETPSVLPVEQPTEKPEGTEVDIATDTETGAQTATIDFNASPAPAEGAEPVKPELVVTLPTTAVVEDFDQEFSVEVTDKNGEASTAATVEFVPASGDILAGIKINAAGAKIGDIIKIIIRKIQAAGNTGTQALALLTEDGEVEAGEETPAEEGAIVLTINVTIYGVEFTKAPATATLGINGPVDVTFETNACVPVAKEETPEEGDQEVTTDAAEEETPDVILSVDGEGTTVTGNVITFTVAGKYTVTATAGNGKYVATTTITVNEAPTVTGIEAVNADAAAGNATVYDLQGRRINRVNAAGIYIVNGVKTLVR